MDALASVLSWLAAQKERYVILSDSNIAMNFNFNKLLEAHVNSGADVTMVYNRTEIPDGARNDNYTIRMDANGRVTELLSNDYRPRHAEPVHEPVRHRARKPDPAGS